MKITFILPVANLSGGIRVVAIYAERLKRRGHEVCVVSIPQRSPSLKDKFKSLLKGNGWLTNQKPKPSHFDNVDVPHQVIDSPRPITDADVPNADVVVATWWETAEWVANLSERKGAKAYFIQHHEVHDYLPKDRVEATYLLPLHKITIAEWLIDLMKTRYSDRNVSLVPNSVDFEQFYAPPRGKQSIPRVGMLYSRTPWKGCDITLKAFSLATQNIPNLHLVAFGSQEPHPDLPLPPDTEYIGQPPQTTIKDLYAKCDAWLFGSRLEGFGLPILEAMACRTPVIGTPAGAAPELLGDGAGVLVKPEDSEDMARAIVQVCSLSDSEWQAMSNAAYAKVRGYTWDDATELFEAALYTAIERWQRGEFSSTTLPEEVNSQQTLT
ncbi:MULTISPECIES: glycosyltransferase family 4 protein [unclassified Coleofasciculus]|uniref:glycosyltransferase family 4 protein n=1 Tax=unclassified Coleofasciculus TaxID=2692782 RepID=UPI001880BAB8|nr:MULTISPECIES: glycosyltransferase family 4 protein [unclassified Coleofasciculus]MBE9125769.1 glycosyltransferase family 4 protein [Coleofasciculus sp. LEGE 07081]MBE9148442.1 glycosyltransferase family 4 protein [Coleofasciculus sp. LEGE 07092]